MAGIILVSKEISWDSSSSAYLWIMDPVATLVSSTTDKALKKKIKLGIETRILALEDASPREMRLLFDMLKKAYADRVKEGGAHFPSEPIYQEYLEGFRALIGVIGEDPRVGIPIYTEEAKKPSAGVRRGP